MIELSDILNDTSSSDRKQLVNIAALLSSDNAFVYNSTYITDNEIELKQFKDNVSNLKSLLVKISKRLDKKIRSNIIGDNLIWAFKLQINNAVEVVSDDISLIVVRTNYENELLKLLTKSNISNFILTLHFKYSPNELIDLDYDDVFDYHIQHSFGISNEKDLRNSINQFISIVKLHYDAKK